MEKHSRQSVLLDLVTVRLVEVCPESYKTVTRFSNIYIYHTIDMKYTHAIYKELCYQI